LIFISPTF